MEKQNRIEIKPFKNAYCDALTCGLGAFYDVNEENRKEILEKLSREDVEYICEYVIVKNKLAGVREINLKVPYVKSGIKAMDKYGLAGNEILSVDYVNGLATKDIVGGRFALEIEDLNAYNPTALTDVCDFCATTDTPIIVHFGRTLESVGQIVNKFGVSPASLLEEYGFLDRECLLYGINYIDKDDQLLLANYNPTLILSPRSDADEGKGEINLYNLIYNRLKFCFSSGNCYNIDMFGEAKLAKHNTNNLMKKAGLVEGRELFDALSCQEGKIEIEFDQMMKKDSIFEMATIVPDDALIDQKTKLEDKIKQLLQKIKEKTNGN